MKDTLTPKELARAIGVSESSLRRWVDAGAIQMQRTVGGHRRIPLTEGLRFIRRRGAAVVRPDLLGLTDVGFDLSDDPAVHAGLYDALTSGDRAAARDLIVSLVLAGRGLPAICDVPIADALHRIGHLWLKDQRAILVEHRATELCASILRELHQGLPAPAADAPLALGGAPESDPYMIPSLMASLVLADAGLREINFGANTPGDLLADAAAEHHARLVWLSISVDLPKEMLRKQLIRLARRLGDLGCHLVIGGRHAGDISLAGHSNVMYAASMSELSAFARGIASAATVG